MRVTNISLVPAALRRDHGRPQHAGAGLYRVVAELGDVERRGDRHHGRQPADHCRLLDELRPAGSRSRSATLRFRAVINPALLDGTKITNTGTVKWNNPPQTASASVSIDVGAIPGVGILNGKAWHDANFNRTLEANERVLEGWTCRAVSQRPAVAQRDRRMRTACIA